MSYPDASNNRLHRAIIAYYGMDDPIMSDAEFDALFTAVYGDSTTPFAVYKSIFSEDGRKRDLASPMLSLAKVHNHDDVARWVTKMKAASATHIVFSPKYDGLPAQVVFGADGTVIAAATRGNGTRGEDVTYAVSHIPDVAYLRRSPSAITRADGTVVAVGEVCLRADRLAAASEAMDSPYTKVRSATAGALRSTGQRVAAGAALLTIRPHWGGTASAKLPINAVNDWAEAVDEFHRMFRASETADGVADDGVVLHAVDADGNTLAHLGDNGHVPHFAVAFKMENELTVAHLADVIWQRNKTKFTPVAVFDPPVDIDGSEVSRASLHNSDIIASLGIAIGDEVYVTLANKVIPQVTGVATKGANRRAIPAAPDHDGADMLAWTTHVLKVLDARGSGPALAAALAEVASAESDEPGPVAVLTALRKVIDLPDLLVENGSVAPANAGKFAANASAALYSLSPAHWLAVAGAEGIGRRMATHLLAKYGTLASVVRELEAGRALVADGFGPSRSDTLHAHKDTVFAVMGVALSIDAAVLHTQPAPTAAATGDGATFVLTGGFDGVPRNDAAKVLTDAGHVQASSVSKTTSALIVAGADPKPSSKTKKAESLGVPVIYAVTVDDALAGLGAL